MSLHSRLRIHAVVAKHSCSTSGTAAAAFSPSRRTCIAAYTQQHTATGCRRTHAAALLQPLSRHRIYAAPHTPHISVAAFTLLPSRGRIFAVAFTLCVPLARCSIYVAALARQLCRSMRTGRNASANPEHDAEGREQGWGACYVRTYPRVIYVHIPERSM